MTSWVKKFENKRANSASRKIPFSLTKSDFMRLHKNATVCDYTGIPFDNSKHAKSIERIDDKDGYHIANCCVVSIRVNQLKDSFIDKISKFSILPEDLLLIEKIKHTLNTKTKEELTAKYKVALKENNMEDKESSNGNGHTDIKLAKDYISFCQGKSDFELSLNDFKKLSNRKTCSITGKAFSNEDSLTKRVILKKDASGVWDKDNTYVVCALVPRLLSKKLFSTKELTKLVDAL